MQSYLSIWCTPGAYLYGDSRAYWRASKTVDKSNLSFILGTETQSPASIPTQIHLEGIYSLSQHMFKLTTHQSIATNMQTLGLCTITILVTPKAWQDLQKLPGLKITQTEPHTGTRRYFACINSSLQYILPSYDTEIWSILQAEQIISQPSITSPA